MRISLLIVLLFLGNLLVTCRIIAIFLFVSEKMISFANYYIEFK